MSTQQGQQSAPQAAPPATVNLAQLDSLVRQYMVVEDIVEVNALPGVSQQVRQYGATMTFMRSSCVPAVSVVWLPVSLAGSRATQGAGQDDATRVGRRQCEAVRDAVRRGDVTQGLVATDAVDSTVLQV